MWRGSGPRGLLDRLRRPAHTGENRCWPCTVLNLLLAAVVGAVLSARSRLVGLVAFGVSVLAIALRGYLVPGTPRVAPRLVDPLPIDFGHGDPGGSRAGNEEGNGQLTAPDSSDPEQLLGALLEAGVLVPEDEDLRLDGEFRGAWRERMGKLRECSTPELAARAARAAPGDVAGHAEGDRVLLAGDRDVWLRPAVAIAETAAAETLAAWDLSPGVRAPAASPLRMFTPVCPVCAGDLQETTVQNCCGGPGSVYSTPEQPVVACRECETVVFEFRE